MDQIAAKELGKHTQLASLELALDSPDLVGNCDAGYQLRLHQHDLLAHAHDAAADGEHPRAVFERLFGDSDSTDRNVRARPNPAGSQHSRFGHAGCDATCRRGLGPGDRAKLDEYLDAIRDVERRIQMAEEQSRRGSCRRWSGPSAFRPHMTSTPS